MTVLRRPNPSPNPDQVLLELATQLQEGAEVLEALTRGTHGSSDPLPGTPYAALTLTLTLTLTLIQTRYQASRTRRRYASGVCRPERCTT